MARRIFARIVFVLAVLASTFTPTAGAEPVELVGIGWWQTAYGSGHCTQDANHYRCDQYHADGSYEPASVDIWADFYCMLGPITPGGNGQPLQIRFIAPLGVGYGCLPNSDGLPTLHNQFYGWWAYGAGVFSGQLFYGQSVTIETFYIWPRDPRSYNAYGTIVKLW